MNRKKQLEEWLKQREEVRKQEGKDKKKPFYVGSRNVSKDNPFNVTTQHTHICNHGTKSNTVPTNLKLKLEPVQPSRYIRMYIPFVYVLGKVYTYLVHKIL